MAAKRKSSGTDAKGTLPAVKFFSDQVSRRILDLAKKNWHHALASKSPGKVALPPIPWFRDLLSICMEASLKTDEGRGVKFTLLVEPNRLTKPEDLDHPRVAAFPFLERIELTADNLVRLAPAVDRRGGYIVVGRGTKSNREGAFYGMAYPTASTNRSSLLARLRRRMPNRLLVTVSAPGKLSISLNDQVVCRIEGTRLTLPKVSALKKGVVPEYFRDAGIAIAKYANYSDWLDFDEDLPEDAVEPSSTSIAACNNRLLDVLGRLIDQMQAMQHGGSIVIAPETSLVNSIKKSPALLDVKYRSIRPRNDQRIPQKLSELVQTVIELDETKPNLAETDQALDIEESTQRYRSALANVVAFDKEIETVAGQLAMLTAVDGALLLTSELAVIGFGAMITDAAKEPKLVRRVISTDGELDDAPVDVRSRGSRHRAAFRLCNELPDALMIVVSQDGDAKFVFTLENEVAVLDIEVEK